MRILSGEEEKEALEFIVAATALARKATCNRSRCGSVIVKDGEIIGSGFNSPPGNLESQRRCSYSKLNYDLKVTDKTCCIHAEQRAVMDALAKNHAKLPGSRIYFMRVDDEGRPTRAGEPYCTICSKMVLDARVAEFVLWCKEGIKVYRTEEYNDVSFDYNG